MIDWVHLRCRDWGDTRYYIDNGKSSPTSIWGRMKDGWHLEASDPAQRPCPPEVMLGWALEISVAIHKAIAAKKMTERQFQVLYMHYAVRGSLKRKVAALKLSKQRYYEVLNRSHRVLRYFLPDSGVDYGQLDKGQLDQLAVA